MARKAKKANAVRATKSESPSTIMQFGVVFIIVMAIALVAYAFKNFS